MPLFKQDRKNYVIGWINIFFEEHEDSHDAHIGFYDVFDKNKKNPFTQTGQKSVH